MRFLLCVLSLLTATACDETVNVNNQAPKVTADAYCRAGDEVRLILSVIDHERDPVDVELQTSQGRIPSAGTGHGLVGLSSESDSAVEHVVVWGSDCENLGAPLGAVTGCHALDGEPPATLEITVLASDDEDLSEPVVATLELADECP